MSRQRRTRRQRLPRVVVDSQLRRIPHQVDFLQLDPMDVQAGPGAQVFDQLRPSSGVDQLDPIVRDLLALLPLDDPSTLEQLDAYEQNSAHGGKSECPCPAD